MYLFSAPPSTNIDAQEVEEEEVAELAEPEGICSFTENFHIYGSIFLF